MFRIGDDLVAVVTESSCDLTAEQLADFDIHVLPMRVNCAQEQFRDGVDLTASDVYGRLEDTPLSTAFPLPEDISALYRSLRSQGCTHILHLSAASALSGSCGLARLIADDFDDLTIDVYDTRTVSCGQGLLVLCAAEALESGMSVDDVIRRLDRCRSSQLTCFTGYSADLLRRSGRIPAAEAALWALRRQTPALTISDLGLFNAIPQGKAPAMSAMEDLIITRFTGQPVRLAVIHGAAPDEADALLSALRDRLEVVSAYTAQADAALAAHSGPGLVGVTIQYVF